MTQNTTPSKPEPATNLETNKPAKGRLVVRTTVKAGDGSTPGMRMNHNVKVAAPR